MTFRALCFNVLVMFCLVAAFPSQRAVAAANPFVRPAELEPQVSFWRRVYTEVTTEGGFIHDDEHLDVVYEVLNFGPDASPSRRSLRIDEAKGKYRRILQQLADGDTAELDTDAQRVRDLWPKSTSRSTFRDAIDHLRFQLGQANRFQEGLVRSGAYMPKIAATFERMGLPRELAALPHVESSFNTNAYSKVGAAGMWQFMRSTGRRYLRIDNVVDERLDPYKATEAAARFLEQNYAVLNSWPLALTAYNHGTAGMRRAQEQLGTDDIVTIIRHYDSKTFGFASRNFYTAFLAALEIDSDPEKFFPHIRRDSLDSSRIVVLPDFVPARSVMSRLDLSMDQLRRLNPSLLPPIWNGAKHIPRGFE
jgi:membrane-bound lytic murein transglycosylase D